jgi:hypothetical protein
LAAHVLSTRAIARRWASLETNRGSPSRLAAGRGSLVLLWIVFLCQVLIGHYYFDLNERLNWFTDAVFIESWQSVEVALTAATVAAASLGILAALSTARAILASLRSTNSAADASPELWPFFSSALGIVCVLWSAWHSSYSVLLLNGFLLSSQMLVTYAAVLLLAISCSLTAARFCKQC